MKGLYRHYKNQKIYQILYTALDVESLKSVIVYKGLYKGPRVNPGNTWIRKIEDFTSKVEVDGKFVNRFQKIKKNG